MSSGIGTSRELFEAIFRAFSSLCKELNSLNITAIKQQQTKCQNELQRLFLWADGVSVQDGYLDEALLRSPDLRSSVLFIILELGNVVCYDLFESIGINGGSTVDIDEDRKNAVSLKLKVHASLQEDVQALHFDSADSSNSESFEPDLDDVLANITMLIDGLMDLSLALEGSMIDFDRKHLEARNPAEAFNVSLSALAYCQKIRDRFPRLPAYLVERLGNANLQRANMLRDIKNTTQAVDYGSGFFEESVFSESIPQVTDPTKLSFSKDFVFSKKDLQKQPHEDFSKSSEATFEILSTSTSMVNQGRFRVPPLPQQAENGNAFRCEYCAKTIKGLFTRRQWK